MTIMSPWEKRVYFWAISARLAFFIQTHLTSIKPLGMLFVFSDSCRANFVFREHSELREQAAFS